MEPLILSTEQEYRAWLRSLTDAEIELIRNRKDPEGSLESNIDNAFEETGTALEKKSVSKV